MRCTYFGSTKSVQDQGENNGSLRTALLLASHGCDDGFDDDDSVVVSADRHDDDALTVGRGNAEIVVSASNSCFAPLIALWWLVQPFLLWAHPCLVWLDFCLIVSNGSDRYNSSSSSSSSVAEGAPTMASIHLSFLLFVVATFRYRRALAANDDSGASTVAVLLLVPEHVMNAVLLLLVTHHVRAAFRVLLAASMGLSIVGAVLMYHLSAHDRSATGRKSAGSQGKGDVGAKRSRQLGSAPATAKTTTAQMDAENGVIVPSGPTVP